MISYVFQYGYILEDILLTDTGELTGVEWCFSGAHMNGEEDMSKLPVEPDGLWPFTINELVSDEGI